MAQKKSLTGSLGNQKTSLAGINTSSMTKSFISYETPNGLNQGNSQFTNFQGTLNGNHQIRPHLPEQVSISLAVVVNVNFHTKTDIKNIISIQELSV